MTPETHPKAFPRSPLRCIRCRLHLPLCVCEFMPYFSLKTRVLVLMQKREFQLVSNTGHLIPKMLSNSEIRFRGLVDGTPLDTHNMIPKESQGVVLYPYEGAAILDDNYLQKQKKPLTLIVPDGNWRQARKMAKRIPALQKLPKVILPKGEASKYRLRSGHLAEGVCTFEAIARALGVIEGDDIQKAMENYFYRMVDRVLWTRHKIRAHQVFGGLPSASR